MARDAKQPQRHIMMQNHRAEMQRVLKETRNKCCAGGRQMQNDNKVAQNDRKETQTVIKARYEMVRDKR